MGNFTLRGHHRFDKASLQTKYAQPAVDCELVCLPQSRYTVVQKVVNPLGH